LVASEPQAFLGTWGSDVESFLANLAQEYRLLAAVDQMIVREPNQADVRSLRRLRDKLVARVESLGRVRADAVGGGPRVARRHCRLPDGACDQQLGGRRGRADDAPGDGRPDPGRRWSPSARC
jgi:hypothetical protein